MSTSRDIPVNPFSKPVTPKTVPIRMGFIGLGNIGCMMAQNMAMKGPIGQQDFPPLLVWNRTESKADQLVEAVSPAKAIKAKDPEEVAHNCDIIFVNLANDDAVRAVYLRIHSYLKKNLPTKNKIFVETSTIYPSLSAELDTLMGQLPHTYLISSPVIGSATVAKNSELLIVMSGHYRSKQEVAYLLVPTIGRKIIDLGGDLQKALTFKLIANSLILGNLEILAEVFTFAEKTGIGGEHVENLIEEYFPAPNIVSYANKMRQANFDGSNGFTIDNGIKDSTHIRRLMAHYNSPMPAIDAAHEHLLTTRALYTNELKSGKATWSTLDWSGIIAGSRLSAGLQAFAKTKDFAGFWEPVPSQN